MDNRLGIAGSFEAVAFGFQFRAQFNVVENLAVEDDPDRFVFVGYRLVTTAQVDDGKPHHPEMHISVMVLTFVVGPSVANAAQHPRHQALDRLSTISGYSAHDSSDLLSSHLVIHQDKLKRLARNCVEMSND